MENLSDIQVSLILFASVLFGGMGNVIYGWLNSGEPFILRKFMTTTLMTFFSALAFGEVIMGMDIMFTPNSLLLTAAVLAGLSFLGMDKAKDGIIGLKNGIKGK
jgi:hypothetical protein